MTVETMDPQKAEAFAGQMVGMLNNALGTLMVSLGHRLGIFDKMAELPPSSVAEIAAATGLNERYIREWLGGMTVSRIVEHDGAAGTYWLPPEHAASITHAAGPGNLATMAQFVALFGNVEDQIIASFQKGGGVPYSEFPKFGALMAELSAQTYDATLIETLKLAPGLTERLQAGIDVAAVLIVVGVREAQQLVDVPVLDRVAVELTELDQAAILFRILEVGVGDELLAARGQGAGDEQRDD